MHYAISTMWHYTCQILAFWLSFFLRSCTFRIPNLKILGPPLAEELVLLLTRLLYPTDMIKTRLYVS
jgi:hypothetical protein